MVVISNLQQQRYQFLGAPSIIATAAKKSKKISAKKQSNVSLNGLITAPAVIRRGRGPAKPKLTAASQPNTGVFSHQWSNNRQMSNLGEENDAFKQLFARATESTPTHHQVVPDLARNMLMTPPESSSYFQPQQYNNNQPTDALHQCEANLMINNNSTLQQGGDQYNNLAALIGTLAQHQQQQQQLLAPALNYFPLHNAPLASQLPDTNLSLPTFLAKQQEAANQQAMQIAIQKELQILYQRHYLQQVMQQQQQLVQQHNNASLLSPLSQHELQTTNYVSGCSPAQSLDQSMDQQFSSSGSSCSSSTAESTSSVNTSVQLPHSRMLTEKESLAVMVLAAGFSPENFSTY